MVLIVTKNRGGGIAKIYPWRSTDLRGTFLPFGPLSMAAVRSMWAVPTSELIEQSRPTRCPEASALTALSRVQLYAPFVFEEQLCIALSDTLDRPDAHHVHRPPRLTQHLPIRLQHCPSPSTAHPDCWVTVKLPVLTYGPPLVGSLLCRGRLCSIEAPSGVINRRQKKQAICAFCSAQCIQRALLAPVSAGRTRPRPGPALRNFC